MRSLFCIAVTFLLTACAQQSHVQLYPGSPKQEEQVLTVIVPYELEVQSINGQHIAAANAMFGTNDKRLHLQPGAYQINAFYKNGFDIDGGLSHEVVRGRTGVFSFEGKAGDLWQLDYERPQSVEEARAFKTEFKASVVNTRTGERHAARTGQSNSSLVSNLLGTSSVPAADRPSTIAPLGAAPAVAPVVQTYSNTVTPMPIDVAGETLPHNDATLTTLKQLWYLMNPESRSAFLDWATQ
ncbi:MAG: DUF2057 family protein [Pseudomonas sp.]